MPSDCTIPGRAVIAATLTGDVRMTDEDWAPLPAQLVISFRQDIADNASRQISPAREQPTLFENPGGG